MDPRRRPLKRLSSSTDLAAGSTQGRHPSTQLSERPIQPSTQPSGKFSLSDHMMYNL